MDKKILFSLKSNQDAKKILNKFLTSIKSDSKKYFCVTLNSLMLFHYLFEKEFKDVLSKCNLIIPESYGIKFIALLYGIKINILPGIDFLPHLFSFAQRKKLSLFLIGSKPSVIRKAYFNIKKSYPGIILKGYHNGYFKNEKIVIKKIKILKPDILLIGMGSVKQEKWIYKNLDNLNSKIIIGIGGAFDIIAGEKIRAPLFLRKLGMEWLFRLIFDFSLTRVVNITKIFILISFVIFKVILSKIKKLYTLSNHSHHLI